MKFIDIRYYYVRHCFNIKVYLSDLWQKLFYKKYRKLLNTKNQKIGRLYFETTNICNAKCVFCAYRKISELKDFKKGVMNFEIFKKAVDEFVEMGGKKISLTPTIGETLIDPGLIQKLDYALNIAKVYVYFYTNGILLNKNGNYKKLIDIGINELDISTELFDRSTFESVYGVDLYNDVQTGLINLLKYNKEKDEPVKINISFRSSQLPSKVLQSKDFINNIKPYLSERVQCDFLVSYDNWCGVVEKNDLKGVMRLKKKFRKQRIPCKRTNDAAIVFDGSVRLCACRLKLNEFDDLVIGNIQNDNLANIFNSEKARTIRKSFIDGNLPATCRGCSLYDSGIFNYYNNVKYNGKSKK